MIYLHPRDFDKDQPVIEGLSLFRKFKSYYDIKQAPAKLNYLLKTHTFEDIRSASEKINWDLVPVVRL
jgi:peptidoglycan-N-acetylglucosamine deacetylase